MSASVGVYMATALFLAIGGETEEAMKKDTWREAGLCDRYCHWVDETPACTRRQMRSLPCDVDRKGASFYYERSLPEEPFFDNPAVRPEWRMQILFEPDWVLSDQPTGHLDRDGQWIKLRL